MRCKEAKSRIKKLERENFKLRHQPQRRVPEDRTYDFNLLEIVVRPKRTPMISYEMLQLDLGVSGAHGIDVPDICNVKRIEKAAIHLVKENRYDFIKHIGEVMARELVDFADKNVPEIAE